MLNCRK